jgi:3-hydroxymyristoyl/3-hydroxydecanoyl-(acyl carrier protein) dehydratase
MTEQRFVWQVPLAHPSFAGHFPGHPILPGVVLLDHAMAFAQAAAAGQGQAGGDWAACTVSQTKFLSPVAPGETLTFVLNPDQRGGWRFAIQAADARAVASGSLTAQQA